MPEEVEPTATGSLEWRREHARLHAIEVEADSQHSTKEQTPAHGTSLSATSTDTNSPTEGTRAHRSLSCPALTTGHHDSSIFDTFLSQAGNAPLSPLTRVFSTTVDSAIQCHNSAVDFSPPGVTPQTKLYKDLFGTADTTDQYANKPEEYKPAMNTVTTIAQVVCKLEWSPVQVEQTETVDSPELSGGSPPCGKPKMLPTIKGRPSLTDQERGALSEQFLHNLEEQSNRTLSLTTTVTATKHYENDEAGGGPSVSTTPECPTNAQELEAIRASQDIMARALLCQSNKMELQLDLFQLLATYLLEIRTKVTSMENLLATTMMGAQCSSSPIIEKLCDLPIILNKLVEAVKLTPSTDKATSSTLPHQRGHLSQTVHIQGQNIAIASVNTSCYEIFQSATRPSIFGRPSGGLSIFIKHAVRLVITELTINSKMAQVITISGVNIDQQNVDLILINCYINAPMKSKAATILELLKHLEMVIFRHPGHKIIMLGDFNIHGRDANTEDPPLDRGRQLFQNFFTTFSLSSARQEQRDNQIGCLLPPSFKGGSTIDYIYLSEKLKQSVSLFEITERAESDHNPLQCTTNFKHKQPNSR
ncbi:hypothetical protein NDU88_007656 [Pleurodeles waltl]|uniref:Endonuclease/exonuclease/phosphatase domain-containing protein n=1 Tax=Pleurodeles waltl TaxID=8319 RepID=A0AAV7NVK3_PLEWA|nr:hypothetical protein NDU88_007656 [Pleurodeles waltl]